MNEHLKRDFESVVKRYTEEFCLMMYGEASHPDDYWIGGDVGGVISIGDEYWGFEQIRKTVDNNYDPKQVFAWYDYCVRLGSIDHIIPVPNLEHWMAGCPRYTEEQISHIETLIKQHIASIESFKEESFLGKESECEK